ncbi:hypothetical protein QT231_16185 [Halomonas sp. SpR1]|uniref:hypothetical protein n=1 Tax=Halomonas sp. SpR1 TaxID=3050462 RepID=UPI0027E3B925|nr:hypothetical protein [Halomonas sp. SpR1]MDQ7734253.1 hypothetical protein [Halomonas sp. SpR1]
MFINTHILSEPLLYDFLRGHLPSLLSSYGKLDLDRIKQITYASWHQRHPQQIDQTFHSHWQNLQERMKQHGSLTLALLDQVARYHLDGDDSRRIAIKMSRFDAWQNWLANQSGLPVIAYQAVKILPIESRPFASFQQRDWLKSRLGYRSLICPYRPMIEDYIQRNGLNESHMHLNGTTTLEAMWHFSLCHPDPILLDLEAEFEKQPRVKLLYVATPPLTHPKHYQQLLKLARELRQMLLAWTQNHSQLHQYLHRVHQTLDPLVNQETQDEEEQVVSGFQIEKEYFGEPDQWTHITELSLHVDIIKKLNNTPSQKMDISYLLYLLCLNCFQRLLVQRDDQYGFDQFQKFADDGIRELYEKDYQNRFYQLHGPNATGDADLYSLEGRFAPKKTTEKNKALIESILRGFLHYHDNKPAHEHYADLNELAKQAYQKKRPALRLVAHFIKKPWLIEKRPHFGELRETLLQDGEKLLEVIREFPELRKIITGIDAAANELEAPPEVFAVLFRHCRRQRIEHFTYHVGEDFEHLLSGIRAIYEAVQFLDLRNGDRLGHATAIGINPQIWLDKMPESLFIARGQWLENLLFLRQIALKQPQLSPSISLAHIEAHTHQLAHKIFNHSIDINTLQQFFSHRDLDPQLIRQVREHQNESYLFMRSEEYKRIKKIPEPRKGVYDCLYQRWFDPEVIGRYEHKQEISLTETTNELLLTAQQYVQQLVVKRHVIIETLPTSNLRISHYQHIRDHHIFRWLGIKDRVFEGDSTMVVVLGSDDPGIFATDMRNEFYHLFSTLITHFNYSEELALETVAKLNENGRIYQFNSL